MSKKETTAVVSAESAEENNTNTNTTLAAPNKAAMEFDTSDIDIPRINIIQRMSQIQAPLGSIVLNKSVVLAEAGQPLRVAVVAAQKGWREQIPFDEDQTARIAYTKEVADRISADSEWGMIEFAEITMLIEQPEGADEEGFPFLIGDKNYALGRINVSKNAYRSTYCRLATHFTFNRSKPLYHRQWKLVSEELTKGKYTWHNPSMTMTKDETSPEVVEFLSNFGA